MGKYIRKAKTSGEVALVDIFQSSLGVRTRAKTLALQRLQKSASSSRSAPSAEVSYLQLRSRRLVKPPISALVDSRRLKQHQQKQSSCDNQRSPNPSEKLDPGSVFRVVHISDSKVGRAKEDEFVIEDQNNESNKDLGVEVSFGDNVLDIEGRDRWVSLFLFTILFMIFGILFWYFSFDLFSLLAPNFTSVSSSHVSGDRLFSFRGYFVSVVRENEVGGFKIIKREKDKGLNFCSYSS